MYCALEEYCKQLCVCLFDFLIICDVHNTILTIYYILCLKIELFCIVIRLIDVCNLLCSTRKIKVQVKPTKYPHTQL